MCALIHKKSDDENGSKKKRLSSFTALIKFRNRSSNELKCSTHSERMQSQRALAFNWQFFKLSQPTHKTIVLGS